MRSRGAAACRPSCRQADSMAGNAPTRKPAGRPCGTAWRRDRVAADPQVLDMAQVRRTHGTHETGIRAPSRGRSRREGPSGAEPVQHQRPALAQRPGNSRKNRALLPKQCGSHTQAAAQGLTGDHSRSSRSSAAASSSSLRMTAAKATLGGLPAWTRRW